MSIVVLIKASWCRSETRSRGAEPKIKPGELLPRARFGCANSRNKSLTAALAGAALGAAAASPGTDHLVAAAIGAGDVHVHRAQSTLHAFGVGRGAGNLDRRALAVLRLGDDVDDFPLAGALRSISGISFIGSSG